MVEANERVVFVNRAYLLLLGFETPSEIIDRHVSGLVAEVDRDRLLDFSRLRADGRNAPVEYPFAARTRNGDSVLIHAEVSACWENGTCYITTIARPDAMPVSHAPLEVLSPRERMVFDLLITGKRAKEIALLLRISEKTVGTLRGRFMRKLGLDDSWDLFRFAASMKLGDPKRLDALAETRLLDTEPEECFDRITRTAARLVKAPAAFISLMDRSRDYYKSVAGTDQNIRQLEGETFCHHLLLAETPLVINNTRIEETHSRIPTVQSLGIAAYLGIPLTVANEIIGALCVVDFEPHEWTTADVAAMSDLAAIAVGEIEYRRATRTEALR